MASSSGWETRNEGAQGKRYLAFVARPENLLLGEPLCLFIKELTPGRRKYEARFVRAVLSSGEGSHEGDTLLLSSLSGRAHQGTLVIKILEDLGDYLTGSPYRRHSGFFRAESRQT